MARMVAITMPEPISTVAKNVSHIMISRSRVAPIRT
jgi:hypothetical protein